MRSVGTRLLILALLACWLAPAALGTYVSPGHSCCRRGGHHCPRSSGAAFRDGKMHCLTCRSLLTAPQAPRATPLALGIVVNADHPFTREFSSAFTSANANRSWHQRGPPSKR